MSNVIDRFNRPDTDDTANANAGTLGIADSGQAWTSPPNVGWRWKVINNQVGRPNGPVGQAIAWVDTGESDVVVEATLAGSGGGYIGIVARVIDDNNHLLFQCNVGSASYFYSKRNGNYTSLVGAPGGVPAYGDRIGFTVKGMTVSMSRNGVFGTRQDLSGSPLLAHVTATNHGLYLYTSAGNRLEDFSVKTPEKTYDGTAWQKHYAKVWNGTAWVTRAARRWNGTHWK